MLNIEKLYTWPPGLPLPGPPRLGPHGRASPDGTKLNIEKFAYLAAGTPAVDSPAAETNAAKTNGVEAPAAGTRLNIEKFAYLAAGTPVAGTLATGTLVTGTLMAGTPSAGTPDEQILFKKSACISHLNQASKIKYLSKRNSKVYVIFSK